MSVNGLLIFCWINVLIQENRACEPNLVKLQSCNTRLQKDYERTSDAEIKWVKLNADNAAIKNSRSAVWSRGHPTA